METCNRIEDIGFTRQQRKIGKHQSLKQMNWENIKARFGLDKFSAKFGSADLVGFVNWTMLAYMSDIWAALLKEICPAMKGPRRKLFVDLADPEKRTEADIARARSILPLWSDPSAPEEQVREVSRAFAERQIERLWVVGSNETTAPLIEASYRRLLALLDGVLRERSYVMGARPGSADFGLYGQLTQLALFDPTPSALAHEHAPRVVAWTDRVDDLSGAWVSDGDWLSRADAPGALRPLLHEIGRVYAPFLLANAAALEKGAERVECRIDGEKWVQRPFPYQGRCLAALRQAHGELGSGDRAAVEAALAGTGCEALFE